MIYCEWITHPSKYAIIDFSFFPPDPPSPFLYIYYLLSHNVFGKKWTWNWTQFIISNFVLVFTKNFASPLSSVINEPQLFFHLLCFLESHFLLHFFFDNNSLIFLTIMCTCRVSNMALCIWPPSHNNSQHHSGEKGGNLFRILKIFEEKRCFVLTPYLSKKLNIRVPWNHFLPSIILPILIFEN